MFNNKNIFILQIVIIDKQEQKTGSAFFAAKAQRLGTAGSACACKKGMILNSSQGQGMGVDAAVPLSHMAVERKDDS